MAKLVRNDLSLLVETWDDPGDYPSNAGAGPLPSYKYIAGMEGDAVYEISWEEAAVFIQEPTDWVNQELDPELPAGILGVGYWHFKLEDLDGPLAQFRPEQSRDSDVAGLSPRSLKLYLTIWAEDAVDVDDNYEGPDARDYEPDFD